MTHRVIVLTGHHQAYDTRCQLEVGTTYGGLTYKDII